MAEYLKDVEYFVTTFGKNTGGNQSAAVFSSGITSNAQRQVFGAIYMLKVLRQNTNIMPSKFEDRLTRAGGNGCEPDARDGNKILEFKSWSPNAADTDIGSMGSDEDYATIGGQSMFLKLANNSFSQTPNSFTQFLCYFSNISSLSRFELWFDARKISTDTPIKQAFKNMLVTTANNINTLTPTGNALFQRIWDNTNLKGNIFDLSATAAKSPIEQFKDIVSNTNDSFYQFIKVK